MKRLYFDTAYECYVNGHGNAQSPTSSNGYLTPIAIYGFNDAII